MINRENIRKTKTMDFTNKEAIGNDLYSVQNNQVLSKDVQDIQSNEQEKDWVLKEINKLTGEDEYQRNENLERILKSSKRGRRIKRQLVYQPLQAAEQPVYGNRFRDRLNARTRLEKQSNVKSALYQKKKNEQMLIYARDRYQRDCARAMEKFMEGREVGIERGQDFKDISQFLASKETNFTEEDKKNLLDCYLGTRKNENGELVGQDKQKALDLMSKALFAIDVPAIKLDSDFNIIRNARKLEAILGQVVAYENMLKSYERQDNEGNTVTYFDDIKPETAALIKEQLDRLRLIALYYANRRDILTDKVYVDHYDDELSENATQQDGKDKMRLARMLTENRAIGSKLRQAYESDTRFQESEENRTAQRERLSDAYKKMDYFGAEGFGKYSSKAVRCSTSFNGLYFSMSDLKKNSRTFDVNSFEMKLVKNQLDNVKKLLDQPASKVGFYEAKQRLLSSFDELYLNSKDYIEKRVKAGDTSERHAAVINIRNYARNCYSFIFSMNEKQFKDITSGNENASLSDVFRKSDVIVDTNEEEQERTKKDFLRKKLRNLEDDFDGTFDKDSDFWRYRNYNETITKFLNNKIRDDEHVFDEVKKVLIKQYDAIITLARSYMADKRPMMSGAFNRYVIAQSALRNAEDMKKFIADCKYVDPIDREKGDIVMEDLLFGRETVTFTETRKGRGPITKTVVGGDPRTEFTDKEEDLRENKYRKAIDFVGGDTTALKNYRTATYKDIDGNVKYGLAYESFTRKVPKGHSKRGYKYVSAKDIIKGAIDNKLPIVYSENALRQLTTIRIMDTIFGKKKRSMESLLYNASTQLVKGEMRIVVSSVLNTSNAGYFGRDEEENAQNQDVREVSILDEKGDLNIGADDRTVADKVMSVSAEDCFAEFEKNGLTLTQKEKTEFTERLTKVQTAFKKDKEQDGGFRKEQDEQDEEKRLNDIKTFEDNLKKYRRWGLEPEHDNIRGTHFEIKKLKIKKVRDSAGLYNSAMQKDHEKEVKNGLLVSEFLNHRGTVEKNLTLQKELENQNQQRQENVDEKQRLQRERVFAARKKILEIREVKAKYKSESDRRRLFEKKRFKDIVEPVIKKETKYNYPPEFTAIIHAFNDYADMDVTIVNGAQETNFSQRQLKYKEDAYKREGELILKAIELCDKRIDSISENTTDKHLKKERSVLIKLKNLYKGITDGKLEYEKGTDIVVKDEAFVSVEFDNVKNELVKTEPQEMNLRKDEPLFTHEPCVSDIAQGYCGDCYFLAATAAIVEHDPSFIKSMMVDNKNGTVTVRLYGLEGPRFITVTKSTPKDTAGKYGRDGDKYVQGALWIKMLEKAFVASGLMGEYFQSLTNEEEHELNERIGRYVQVKNRDLASYEVHNGGDQALAARILTGKVASRKDLWNTEEYSGQFIKGEIQLTTEQSNFLKLAEGLGKNKADYALTASTDTFSAGENVGLKVGPKEKGIYNHHVYTIMGVREVSGEKLIVLRNPWGASVNDFAYEEKTGNIYSEFDDDPKSGGFLFLPVDTFFRMFRHFNKIET